MAKQMPQYLLSNYGIPLAYVMVTTRTVFEKHAHGKISVDNVSPNPI